MNRRKGVGVSPVLVALGYGKGEWLYRRHTWCYQPLFVAKDLQDAVQKTYRGG